jgi:polysaccharide deacetylase family protein (PEP-CTERM system associated)
MHHILTIDLEDWFHGLEADPARWPRYARRVEVGTRVLLDLLDDAGARATFFVLGDVARHAPALVREVAARGHDLGSHGTSHQLIASQSPATFARDLRDSLARLADLTGAPVRSYRAPFFSITRRTLWALDILVEHGIAHDSSIFPVVNHRYGIPDASPAPHAIRPGLMEWPISVLPTPLGNVPFAGGVYFRWLPMALVERGFAAHAARGQPVVFYLHPWELDPAHPRRYRTPPFQLVRHYGRLGVTAGRLARLLARHRFHSLADAARA